MFVAIVLKLKIIKQNLKIFQILELAGGGSLFYEVLLARFEWRCPTE
jgi:hypothetical protein